MAPRTASRTRIPLAVFCAVASLASPTHAQHGAKPSRRALHGEPEWILRERAAAAAEPAHQPHVEHDSVSFGRRARFGDDGARIVTSDGEISIALAAVGRHCAMRELTGAAARSVFGPEVRLVRGPGIVEWWRSLASGLEQGVTLSSRPPGRGLLRVEMAVRGLRLDLRSEDEVLLRGDGNTVVAAYAHLIVTDARGTRVPARMTVRGNRIAVVIDDRSATYPLVVDPLVSTLEATLITSDRRMEDVLGTSVSLSGDGSRALVAMAGDDTAAGVDTGSARVFVRTGTTWSEEATLLHSGAAANDGDNGVIVALSADGTRAAVGIPGDGLAGGPAVGSVRVFARSGTTWSEEATLASASTAGSRFGSSVAITDDGSRIVVGFHADAGFVGSARVFVRWGSSWTEEAQLLRSDAAANEGFGYGVAISGDGSSVLVGARNDSGGGSARVFVRSGAAWTEDSTLTAPGSFTLGWPVALSADGARAFVSDPGREIAGFPSVGAVHVFVRSGGIWSPEAMLVSPRIDQYDDSFGEGLAVSSDGSRVLVGFPGDDDVGTDAGSALVLGRSGSTWSVQTVIYPTDYEWTETFGRYVALTDDGVRALVAVPQENVDTASTAGAAYVFTLRAPTYGDPCGTAADCDGLACVDGFCCNTACGGGSAVDCEACSSVLTGVADGTCAPVRALASIVCRPTAGPCDVSEQCDGASSACPPDVFAAAGTCRAAAGVCDVPEICTGASAACPADIYASDTTECRPSGGECDPSERCTGAAPTCPSDVLTAGTIECRPAAGLCDVPELCTGTTPACPPDALVASSTICRSPAGPCDLAEECTGASAACPPDVLAAGTICRASTGACDVAEACTGADPACPTDLVQLDGTECSDGSSCTSGDSCQSGACTPGAPLACDDGDACTVDTCAEAGGCEHALLASCSDGGRIDAGADAGEPDAAIPTDAGSPDARTDAGAVEVPGAGCACAALGGHAGPFPTALALAALAIAATRTARRRNRRHVRSPGRGASRGASTE